MNYITIAAATTVCCENCFFTAWQVIQELGSFALVFVIKNEILVINSLLSTKLTSRSFIKHWHVLDDHACHRTSFYNLESQDVIPNNL